MADLMEKFDAVYPNKPYVVVQRGPSPYVLFANDGPRRRENNDWIRGTHHYGIILEKWRFDWREIDFPWGKSRKYSLCYTPPVELNKPWYRQIALWDHVDANPNTWIVNECWTLEHHVSYAAANNACRNAYCRRFPYSPTANEHGVDTIVDPNELFVNNWKP